MFPSFAFKKPSLTRPIKNSYLLSKSYVIWEIVKLAVCLVFLSKATQGITSWNRKNFQIWTCDKKKKKIVNNLTIYWQCNFFFYFIFYSLLLHLLFHIYLLSSLLMYDAILGTQETITLEYGKATFTLGLKIQTHREINGSREPPCNWTSCLPKYSKILLWIFFLSDIERMCLEQSLLCLIILHKTFFP